MCVGQLTGVQNSSSRSVQMKYLMVQPPSSKASLEETDAREAASPAHTAREKPSMEKGVAHVV